MANTATATATAADLAVVERLDEKIRQLITLVEKSRAEATKLRAHDEQNVCKEGDTVAIVETRPLSATKRFRLVEVLKTSGA